MYSWSRQLVLCQAIQASQRKMSGGLTQIPIVKKACLAKQEWSSDAYSSLFVTIHRMSPQWMTFVPAIVRCIMYDQQTCTMVWICINQRTRQYAYEYVWQSTNMPVSYVAVKCLWLCILLAYRLRRMQFMNHGEWTLWPFQFSSQTDIEHCKVVVVFKVTDTWKMKSEVHFAKFKTKLQCDSEVGVSGGGAPTLLRTS